MFATCHVTGISGTPLAGEIWEGEEARHRIGSASEDALRRLAAAHLTLSTKTSDGDAAQQHAESPIPGSEP
ncbi:hypothetical protein P3T16_006325 [Paraburkholderia sp. GAS42]